MFDKILESAHGSGGDVLVQIKNHCCEQYRGRVQDLDAEYFTLFHSGPGGGVLWAFKREDIAFCGLIVEFPSALSLEDGDACPTTLDVQAQPTPYERKEGE